MRNLCLLCFVVPGALVACGDDHPATPDGPPPEGTTIAITTGQPAALVAFRDGVDGPWQSATMKTPTSFEAQVHGPYMVSVVCDDVTTNPDGSFHSWDTRQAGRTLDDPHEYAACDVPANGHAITGHMVQAGTVILGNSSATSSTGNWDFKLSAANGTYDLIATTSDGIAVRRGVAVNGDLALGQPVDVVQQGAAFVTADFSVANAMAGETIRAAAFLETGTNPLTALLYNGAATAVKVAPNTALQGTDSQTVSLRALSDTANGTAIRTLRRTFRVGGDTSYTLPKALGDPQWALAGAQAAVSWTMLPVMGTITENIDGVVPGGGKSASYELALTTSFVTATAPTRAVIDTDIPGYKPQWRVDLTVEYSRQLQLQHIADGVVTSLAIDEMITPTLTAGQPAPRSARAPGCGRSAQL